LAQLFPKWLNRLPLVAAVVAPIFGLLAVAGFWIFASPEFIDAGYQPEQPVPYSHAVHVGKLKLDCRYCHTHVERSHEANLPPTSTCMNCHSIIKAESDLLEPIRVSFETDQPMQWVRVHNLADYAYFNHASHIRAGVGCVSCHGKIQEMEVVWQEEPLSMGWCLDCHRNPAPHLRPTEEVTNMEWAPAEDHAAFVARTIEEKQLRPPVDCSGCHR
jgi:hypothetical protein